MNVLILERRKKKITWKISQSSMCKTVIADCFGTCRLINININ